MYLTRSGERGEVPTGNQGTEGRRWMWVNHGHSLPVPAPEPSLAAQPSSDGKIPWGKRRGIRPSCQGSWEAFGGGQGFSEANAGCEPRVHVGWSIFLVEPHMALLPSPCVDRGHEWGSSPLFWGFRTSFEHHLLLEPLLAPLASRPPELWHLLTRTQVVLKQSTAVILLLDTLDSREKPQRATKNKTPQRERTARWSSEQGLEE